METDDARSLLGVIAEASQEEIKAAYSSSVNKARERLQRERSQKKRESERRKLDSDFDALVAQLQEARDTLIFKPTPVQPEPTPVQPEPTPVQPEPTPVQPEPTPVQPEPTPVQPEPTPVQPEQTPVQPEQTPVQPKPTPPSPLPIWRNLWVLTTGGGVLLALLSTILILTKCHPEDGKLIVNTDPSQAKVLLDGILRGAAPQEVPGLSPGQHRLRIEKEGYGPVELMVSVNPGNQVTSQYITLSPALSPSPGPTAKPPESPETLFAQAEALRKGDGVPKDLRKAFALYLRAAEGGLAPAQHRVGVAYALGEGVEQNDSEAVAWYKKAAEQGLAEAEYDLGVHYVLGRGVQQDVQAGVEWYRKAAAQGYQAAIDALKDRNLLADQIGRFVEDHLRRRETGDMDRLIADYGEQVDYQGKGRVNREHIRSDHLGYFRDWPERHYQIAGKIDVSDTLTRDIKEAKFNYTYEVRTATGRRAGWAADTWLISVNGDRFLIVSEQETVDKGSQER